jgi:hypothetical protein
MFFGGFVLALLITLLLIIAFLWRHYRKWPRASVPVFLILFLTPWASAGGLLPERAEFMRHSWIPFVVAGIIAIDLFAVN